eukprot:scaffold5557_cov154-Skeletonema_marinoi.AAC.5
MDAGAVDGWQASRRLLLPSRKKAFSCSCLLVACCLLQLLYNILLQRSLDTIWLINVILGYWWPSQIGPHQVTYEAVAWLMHI